MPKKSELFNQLDSGDVLFTLEKPLLQKVIRGGQVIFTQREICCDCGLTHRTVGVSDGQGDMIFYSYRDDAYTRDHRKLLRAKKKRKKKK